MSLQENAKGKVDLPPGARVAVVASRYNGRYVDGMVRSAKAVLRGCRVEVIRVPGAFEIPVAARWLLARPVAECPDAVLCFGVIWQGQTRHADHVATAVTHALMSLQTETGIPCIHEVLQVATPAQARERCLDPATNRGVEAARTAIEMIHLGRRWNPKRRHGSE